MLKCVKKHIISAWVLYFCVTLKRLLLISSSLWILCTQLQAQEMEGVVFDKSTKQRVPRVYVYNMANDDMTYNDKRGEFSIKGALGDTLIAVAKGYYADTMVIRNSKTAVFNLQRSTIWLNEVSIVARKSPSEILNQRKQEFGKAYREGEVGNVLSTAPMGGAGLSIDALYSLLSRRGKNARHLQELIEREYENNVIDTRFTPEMVSGITNLKGTALHDFMQQYRPTYFFVTQANDYTLGQYIRDSYRRYKQNPNSRRLQTLPKVQELPKEEEEKKSQN